MKTMNNASGGNGGTIKVVLAAGLILIAVALLGRWLMQPRAGESDGPTVPAADYHDTSKSRGGPAIAPGQSR